MLANEEGELNRRYVLHFHNGYEVHACAPGICVIDDFIFVTMAAFNALDCDFLKVLINDQADNPYWYYMYAMAAPEDDIFARICLQRLASVAKERKAYLYLQMGRAIDRAESRDKLEFGMCRMKICDGCDLATAKCRLCAGCRKAHYCSVACQKRHWKSHKRECRRGRADA